jgi:hypothetical protein
VQDYIVFTFDDYQSGQPTRPYPGPLNHIVSIHEERYKLAKYNNVEHPEGPYEWEMYDRADDPLETKNLAYSGYEPTPAEQAEFVRLQQKLARVEQMRLQPLPTTAFTDRSSANSS